MLSFYLQNVTPEARALARRLQEIVLRCYFAYWLTLFAVQNEVALLQENDPMDSDHSCLLLEWKLQEYGCPE